MKPKTFYDHNAVSARLQALRERYPALQISRLSRSILGRDIPMVTLGTGEKCVVYVGAQRGTEGQTAALLLDFTEDYLRQLEKNALLFEKRMSYLFSHRRVILLPMLNPDGVAYATAGSDAANPLNDRAHAMNGGDDFSAWQANARGVDLTKNYGVCFAEYKAQEQLSGVPCGAPRGYSGEYPESEPEVAALCRFLRALQPSLLGVLELSLGGERIRCSCADKLAAKTTAVGRILRRVTGYRLETVDTGTGDGLASWCIERLSRPAYAIGCGKTAESVAKQRAATYEMLREALFTFPIML